MGGCVASSLCEHRACASWGPAVGVVAHNSTMPTFDNVHPHPMQPKLTYQYQCQMSESTEKLRTLPITGLEFHMPAFKDQAIWSSTEAWQSGWHDLSTRAQLRYSEHATARRGRTHRLHNITQQVYRYLETLLDTESGPGHSGTLCVTSVPQRCQPCRRVQCSSALKRPCVGCARSRRGRGAHCCDGVSVSADVPPLGTHVPSGGASGDHSSHDAKAPACCELFSAGRPDSHGLSATATAAP
jgi:hypothetical protein